MARKPSNALVAQGIEHRFPKPNHGARLPPRKPNDFLAVTVEWPLSTAIRELGNTPRFPTISGNCCAEVVLESSTALAYAVALPVIEFES